MIAFYIGKSEAAIYAIAYTISMMVRYISNAVNQSFLPYLYRSIKSESLLQVKNVQIKLLILVLGACVSAMAFAPEILMIFATSEYSAAIEAIPSIVISTYFIFLYNHFCYVEMYFEKNVFIMAASIIAALLNIGLNAICIPSIGFVAAGYTTLISYIVFCCLHYAMYKKILVEENMSDFYDTKTLAVISVLAVLITIFMQLIYSYIMVRYLIIIGILLVGIICKNKVIDLLTRK